MNIVAICKDCGNGTLNGAFNPQFTLDGDVVRCMNCSSSHVDVVSVDEDEDLDFVEEFYAAQDAEHTDTDGCCECGSKDHVCQDCPVFQSVDPYSDEAYENEVGA